MQACWLENRLFLMDKNVFSAEYLNWICDLTAMVPPPTRKPHILSKTLEKNDGSGVAEKNANGWDADVVESSAAKVALYLALDTVARAKDKERLSQLMLYVRSWFRASPSLCRWALEQVRERVCVSLRG